MANVRITDWTAATTITPASDVLVMVDVSDTTQHASGTTKSATITQVVAAVKLDDLAAPENNTDLNTSTSAHGLAPMLNNVPTDYLNGQGAWTTPAGGTSLPADDGTALVKGSADTTKRVRIEADTNVPTGTTVVVTAPAADVSLVPGTTYAAAASGVTNGNTHDHSGGDGAQIAHGNLSGIGSNTHATLDSHVAASAAHGVSGAIVGTTDTQNVSGKIVTLRAGTATAGTAPLKFTSGTNLTAAETGAIEFDGTDFYFTLGSTRLTLGSIERTGPIPPWSASRRYNTTSIVGTSTTTQAGGSGTIVYTQFYIPTRTTLGNVYWEVTTGVGSATARAGLYTDAGGTPGDNLYDSGAVEATTTTTPVKSASFSSLVVSAGHYWLAFRCSNNSVQLRAVSQTIVAPWIGEATSLGTMGGGPTQRVESGTYGAFPATAAPSAATSANLILLGVSKA